MFSKKTATILIFLSSSASLIHEARFVCMYVCGMPWGWGRGKLQFSRRSHVKQSYYYQDNEFLHCLGYHFVIFERSCLKNY